MAKRSAQELVARAERQGWRNHRTTQRGALLKQRGRKTATQRLGLVLVAQAAPAATLPTLCSLPAMNHLPTEEKEKTR